MAFLFLHVPFSRAQDPEFGQIEVQVLSEVTITACAAGKVPCIAGHAEFGCVPDSLDPKAFEKACEKFRAAQEEFVIDCFVTSRGKRLFVGKTRTQAVCEAMQSVWDEVAVDPYLKDKSDDWRLRFLRNTLLKPRSVRGRDNPGIADQLRFKKSGRIRKSSDESERLLEKARLNLQDYRMSLDCGPGIVPGIDQVPVLHQGQQGTCFAHSASTLVDYVRKVRSSPQYPVFGSPLMGAIDYHLNSAADQATNCRDPFNAGFTCETFNLTMKKGFCASAQIEEAIKRSYSPTGRARKVSWYHAWSRKNEFVVQTESFKVEPDDKVLEYLEVIGELYKKKDWVRLRELHQKLRASGKDQDQVCSIDPAKEDLSFTLLRASPNLESFYAAYFEPLCSREPATFQATCTERSQGITESHVDTLLGKGYPVGIYYCSALLGNSAYRSPATPITKDPQCQPHASLIVGTAIDSKGSCAYVVRNSWGTGCSFYDKKYDCKDGHIYIPKEKLLKQTYRLQEVSVP